MSRNMVLMETLIVQISMGPFGSDIKVENFVSEGIPVLNGSNINGIKLSESFTNYLTKEKADSLKKANAKRGDIVITHRGTLGQIAYIPENSTLDRYVISQSQFRVALNRDLVDPAYFSYYFHTNEGQQRLLSFKSHVGVPALAQATTNFRQLQFPLKPLSEQLKISNVLLNIDLKIELNNNINAELEAMAKLIYDYWFVQFDFPDTNGKPYKSSGGKMVYNEELKREIPKGWDVDIINNVIDVKDGTHDSPKPKNTGYPLITSKHLKPEGLDFAAANLISEEDYVSVNKRSKVDTGDILFSMIGSIGEIYKVDEQDINFAIKNVALYKSSKKPEYINFIYMFLRSYDMQRYMGNVTSGSIQKFIGLGALRTMPILINDEMIMKFVKTTEHLFQKKTLIKLENQKLTQLRDWLLPMLMNGQVSIKQ
jgi:type I restriction enzyme S subunit